MELYHFSHESSSDTVIVMENTDFGIHRFEHAKRL